MKKEKELRPGTIVRHVAGGPLMAVTSNLNCYTNEVVCEWFTADGQLKTGKFEMVLLLKKN